jgi:putative SOS response-associated peptidase YedK
MCGRFTLRTPQNVLVTRFMLETTPSLFERYNVAPTQESLVVRAMDGHRQGVFMRWGLIPSWAKDSKIGASLINARAETIAEKPAYRTAFQRRRCLVPADGYYEWKREGKRKLPFLYERKDGAPFALAAVWDSWQGMETFSVLTTSANELAQEVHDRMPVILSELDYAPWLDDKVPAADLLPLLTPFPASDMTCRAVSPTVNNARNEGPECITPPPVNRTLW